MTQKYVTYISRFYLRDHKCFHGENNFNLLDNNNKPIQWTVILGNNNTGKTSILKALATLEPTLFNLGDDEHDITALPLQYSLNNGKHNDINNEYQDLVGCDILIKKKTSNKSYFSGNFELYSSDPNRIPFINPLQIDEPEWSYTTNSMYSGGNFNKLQNLKIYGYGVTRRAGNLGLKGDREYNSQTLFMPNESLINIEDWLLQLDYASKNGQAVASENIIKLKKIFKSGIFPELTDFKFISSKSLRNHVEFKTKDGWFILEELGYGYQTTLSWFIDFCKKMFERYPRSNNPLAEPALVLIDEIDLHLHPSWQKNIVKFLSDIFPGTQFIVTTHSPQVIQSIDKLNLFILQKAEKGIKIHKSSRSTFKGWSVEEILEDIMHIENGTYSSVYNELVYLFDKALDTKNREQAIKAFDNLDEILHPESAERKILKLQLSQILKK
ncbi:AAA family ATPase [Marinifilum sp. N1E240]|uniref:AAA family ATPase n=1 Tax=Marinifilum sp. N1E240 TaxID=2608082 RepID=UPI00128D1098|nr:ATP-binding protein [Marinifilum sp. N1E240]MPQ46587.1 AAA family ATPase [Marinifilum sp. N1E240]